MTRPPLVLMYHGVDIVSRDEDPHNMFVPPAVLDAQLTRLRERHGYTFLTEAQYLGALEGGPVPQRSCLITFDDGYVSVRDNALPVLQRHEAPSVCYVSPSLFGQQPKPGEPAAMELLDAAGVRELAASGVTIGSHSDVHDSLTARTAAQLEVATVGARDAIRELVGVEARTFAYPYGDHDAAARQAVEKAGYACAFATYDGAGRYALARVDVNATDTERSFDLKLTRIYPLARRLLGVAPPVRRAIHTIVGRAERTQ